MVSVYVRPDMRQPVGCAIEASQFFSYDSTLCDEELVVEKALTALSTAEQLSGRVVTVSEAKSRSRFEEELCFMENMQG